MRQLFFNLIQLISVNYVLARRKKNTLYVLMFHQVNDKGNRMYPATPVKVFEQWCAYLARYMKVIHISEIETHFKTTTSPAAVITFDDGLDDIKKNAYPILRNYRLKFNINIDTEILETGKPQDNMRVYDVVNYAESTIYKHEKFVPGGISIDHSQPTATEFAFSKVLTGLNTRQRREFSDDVAKQLGKKGMSHTKVLSREDLKQMAEDPLVEIGSHSHTHSMLTRLSAIEYFNELQLSKTILEGIINKPVDIFAFPNGLGNEEIEKSGIKIGYKYFLYTEDKPNNVSKLPLKKIYRINQYHQSFTESLASTFGVHTLLRKITG